MPSISKDHLTNIFKINAVIKGTLLTLLTSLLLSITAGIVYHFSSITDLGIPWIAAVILAASSLAGSMAAGKEAGNKGLYNGLAVGLLFFLIVWLLAGLFAPGLASLGIIYKFLIVTFSGAFGGMVGVGLS